MTVGRASFACVCRWRRASNSGTAPVALHNRQCAPDAWLSSSACWSISTHLTPDPAQTSIHRPGTSVSAPAIAGSSDCSSNANSRMPASSRWWRAGVDMAAGVYHEATCAPCATAGMSHALSGKLRKTPARLNFHGEIRKKRGLTPGWRWRDLIEGCRCAGIAVEKTGCATNFLRCKRRNDCVTLRQR